MQINKSNRIISSLVVRPKLVRGYQPYFVYHGTKRVNFDLYGSGETDDEWKNWLDNLKSIIRMHIKEGNIYVRKI